MKALKLVVWIAIMILSVGCSKDLNQEAYDQLSKGMTREECERILGQFEVQEGIQNQIATKYATPGQVESWALSDSLVTIDNYAYKRDGVVLIRLQFQQGKLSSKASPYLNENW